MKAQKNYGAVQDYDFPKIWLQNYPLYGFEETGFKDFDLVKKQLILAVKDLEKVGVDFIGIACNTVHHYYQEMQTSVSLPIINLISESVNHLKDIDCGCVGVLSSQSTRELCLYHDECDRKGIKFVDCTDKEQKIINNAILKVLSGDCLDEVRLDLYKIIDKMIDSGATAILLGCTELPLIIINNFYHSISIISSSDVLADKILEMSYVGKSLN